MVDVKLGDIGFVKLPPNYSEADREARTQIAESIRDLELAYRKAIKPYINMLTKIDAKYEPRWMLDPSATIDPPEWMKEMIRTLDDS